MGRNSFFAVAEEFIERYNIEKRRYTKMFYSKKEKFLLVSLLL